MPYSEFQALTYERSRPTLIPCIGKSPCGRLNSIQFRYLRREKWQRKHEPSFILILQLTHMSLIIVTFDVKLITTATAVRIFKRFRNKFHFVRSAAVPAHLRTYAVRTRRRSLRWRQRDGARLVPRCTLCERRIIGEKRKGCT